ncbi:DEAD/DEAH box helicase family protein [Streptomyces parvus]|uniref:DEAD/DEAH box helicase family protein n=1 Tax=Streptomyces parvus TaxID=66428 RepID=UPI0033D92947
MDRQCPQKLAVIPPAGRHPLPAPPSGVLYDRGCRYRPGLPERRALFPDQVEAVFRVARHLRRPGTRGLYVAATGTGKTLVSIRVADELQARLVLRRAHPRPGRPDRTGMEARRPHRAHGHRLLHGRCRPRRTGLRPHHVQQRPRHPGRPHVGRGGEG